MAVIFYLTFFLFNLGQLGRISLNNGQINFYLYEVFLTFIFIWLFIKFKLAPLKQTFAKYKIIYIFFLWLLSTSVFRGNIISFLYLFRLLFYPLFFLYLSNLNIKKNTLKKGFFIFILITLISSFVQYFFYPDLHNLLYLGWDPHLNRMFGTFFDTSIAATIYSLIFLYLFKNKKYFLSIFPLICLVLTFSRSAYITLGLTLLINFFSKKYIEYALLTIAVFILIFTVAPKQFGTGVGLTRSFSLFSRIDDYKNALVIWKKYPLTGIGYNRIANIKKQMKIFNQKENIPVNSASSFSSSYLIILVTTGLIGLSLFLMSLWKVYKNNRNIFAYLFFIGLLSFADNILLHPFIMTIFGVLILLSDN